MKRQEEKLVFVDQAVVSAQPLYFGADMDPSEADEGRSGGVINVDWHKSEFFLFWWLF